MEEEILLNVEHALKNFNGRAIDCIAVGEMLIRYKELKRINSDLQCEQEQLYDKIDKLTETTIRLSKECVELEEENKKLKVQCENEFKRGFFMKVAENYEKTNAEIIKVPSLYIPKSVIRDKIDKLNENRDMISGGYAISVLQELLKE